MIEYLYQSNRLPSMSRWVREDDTTARFIFAKSGWTATQTREAQPVDKSARLNAFARLELVNKDIAAHVGDITEIGPLLAKKNEILREIQKIEEKRIKAAEQAQATAAAAEIVQSTTPDAQYMAPTATEIAEAEEEGDPPPKPAAVAGPRTRKPGPRTRKPGPKSKD